MARGKDTLSEKELSVYTVRDLLILARHAKIEVPKGAKKDALVKTLLKAKVPAGLAKKINEKKKNSDKDDSDSSDSDKDSETSHEKTKKKKRTKKTPPDSDKSDSGSDSDDLAVMARHTGIDRRVLRRTPKDWGEMDVVLSPPLWVYMFITEPQLFSVLRKPRSLLPGRLYRRLALLLQTRFPEQPAFIKEILEHLIAAHELCEAAKVSCADKAGNFSWRFFWRCYGDRVERWGEHISSRTDLDITARFGAATTSAVRAQRKIVSVFLPLGQREMLQRTLKKRRTEDGAVPLDSRPSAGLGGNPQINAQGRRCRRCKMLVAPGGFAAHNVKGVCPKKK